MLHQIMTKDDKDSLIIYFSYNIMTQDNKDTLSDTKCEIIEWLLYVDWEYRLNLRWWIADWVYNMSEIDNYLNWIFSKFF